MITKWHTFCCPFDRQAIFSVIFDIHGFSLSPFFKRQTYIKSEDFYVCLLRYEEISKYKR